MEEQSSLNRAELQERILRLQAQNCLNGTRAHEGWCPTTWDGILCWASTAGGELAVQSCPDYITGFDGQANATRQCMPSGDWYWSPEQNNTWTNFTRCFRERYVTVLVDLPDLQGDNVTFSEKYLPTIKYISKVGYAVSFSSLVVAFCILASIKKLRCQRNILHMHLFASFIVRAFAWLLKDLIFVAGVGLSTEVLIKDGESYLRGDSVEGNWHCKAFTSLWQYCILANYAWILMEGLYLHNLIFCALFADPNASIAIYVIIGWGLPAVVVGTWVVLRALYEDSYCWTTHDNNLIFQVIRVPTTVSVVINFVLFVNIVRVLMLKLKSTVSEDTLRYKKWARSTLVLVPLFGVHYSIFLAMSYSMGNNRTVELVWLFSDQFFASFQGSFVAVLYCFLNGEVRSEMSRALRARDWPPLLGRFCRCCCCCLLGARPSIHSGSTCSCNATGNATGNGKHHHHQQQQKRSAAARVCCLSGCCRRLLASCRHALHHGHHRSTHSMASTQADIGIATRGGSLASSRGYLEVAGVGGNLGALGPNAPMISPNSCLGNGNLANCQAALCKNMDQSLLSFCSNTLEGEACAEVDLEKCEHHDEESDSECCQLAYELDHLHHPDDP